MQCKYYKSMESYYGVAGHVPVMTSGFWECEPEPEDLEEYFLEWLEENGELLEPNWPDTVHLYCEECDDTREFQATPSEIWTPEELLKINIEAIKKWKERGDIDEEDEKELIEDAKHIFERSKK